MRGKLIVIEGTDGSGKNTQSELLINKLNNEGKKCRKLSFPVYDSPTGKVISMYLGKNGYKEEFGSSLKDNPKVAAVFYALNRNENKYLIEHFLYGNSFLVLDRYVDSNCAHQGSKIDDSQQRMDFFNWVYNLEYETFKLPKPDLTVFLHLPYLESINLIKKRGIPMDAHELDQKHLEKSEKIYLELALLNNWKTIECINKEGELRKIEEISDEVLNIVKDMF